MRSPATPSTARLNLRRFVPADAVALHQLLSVDGVLDYFPPSGPLTLARIEKFIEGVQEGWRTNGYGLWALELSETGALIGRGGLEYLPETQQTEVDFIIAREYWGRGLATEVGNAALTFGFGQLGLERVIGLAHPDNLASKKVLEKIGMSFDVQTEYFGMTVDRYAVDSTSPVQEE